MMLKFLWPLEKGRLESSSSFCRGYKRNVGKNPGLRKRAPCAPGFGHLLAVSWASCPISLIFVVAVILLMNHLILRSMGDAQVQPLTTVGPLLLASLVVLLLGELVPSNSIPSIPLPSGHSSGRQSLVDPLPSLEGAWVILCSYAMLSCHWPCQ